MTPETYVRFASPITLDLRVAIGPRPRVVPDGDSSITEFPQGGDPVLREFDQIPLHVRMDSQQRTISAYLPPVPQALELYGPEDFDAAASDSQDDFAERVLQILGEDPAATLQALIDRSELPPRPPRIPRSIRAWQARTILREMNLLDEVEAMVAASGDIAMQEAWDARENLARRGPSVTAVAAQLGLTDAQVNQLFISAGALVR